MTGTKAYKYQAFRTNRMLALAMELAVNYTGYQRDVVMSDAYTWVRAYMNRIHYVATTQTNGIKRLADIYWEDALDVTHKAHLISNRYRKFAWSDPNGLIDFRPEPTHHNKPGPPSNRKTRCAESRAREHRSLKRHPKGGSGGSMTHHNPQNFSLEDNGGQPPPLATLASLASGPATEGEAAPAGRRMSRSGRTSRGGRGG